jgi:hypothetical protein
MPIQYTITLSDAENKALGVIANSQEEWINYAIRERCRIAIDEIVAQEVERTTAIGGTLSGTKDEIVMSSTIKSAAERHNELVNQQLPEGVNG